MTWKMIGHDWAVTLLKGHIRGDTLRHAYLITGPEGVGKQTLAIRLIQAICCPSSGENTAPCLVCPTCRQIQRLEFPDLFPIRLQANSKLIKIEQIRELIRNLALSPYQADHRFGLLPGFDRASPSAQNALLKTLEEPPAPAILVLTASNGSALYETITSRCEEIKLNPVSVENISRGLINQHNLPEKQAKFLAHISDGRPERALSYHQDHSLLENRQTLLDSHSQVIKSSLVDRFSFAEEISKDRDQAGQLLQVWSSLWHDVLHQAGGADIPLRNPDRQEEIAYIAGRITLQTARASLESFHHAHHLLEWNANLRLTMEDLLLQLPTLPA